MRILGLTLALVSIFLCFAQGAALSDQIAGKTTVIKLEPGEVWWGGAVNEGHKMPFGSQPYSIDLYGSSFGNQCAPLLVSSNGRYVWSEKPYRFEFLNGSLTISGARGPVVTEKAGNSLAEACRAASSKFFPASGKMPDPLLFTRPQFNTWIELVYNQNQTDILKYAHAVVDNGFPPGVLMIDANWQRYYGNFEFKAERFPNPRRMVDELHGLGFKVMLWVCPFVSPDSEEYRQLAERKLFLMQGKPGTATEWKDATKPAIIEWWDGYSVVLDFSNPAAVDWFKTQLSNLQTKYGIDGFKLDAGDTDYYPESAVSYGGVLPNDQTELFGKIGVNYPLNEFRAMWKMGGQPLVERLRDKFHTWEDLRKLIPHTFMESLMGYWFTCPDLIGGGDYASFLNLTSYDQDLVVRSAQCQALMPMMQFSAAPWRVLDRTRLDAVKRCVDTRQRFVPYIMELAERAARAGGPIVTPLEYYFPNQGYSAIADEFMLGTRILVAPVVNQGQTRRSVVLPQGRWKADDGTVYEGGQTVVVDAPIARLPYFVRMVSG
jgi:alpha-glucosidase (family GH31 glycosyl hydrolase)